MTKRAKRILLGIVLTVLLTVTIIGYYTLKELQAAGKQFQEFREDIQTADALAAKAKEYEDNGQYAQAVQCYRQTLTLLRSNWRARNVINNLAWLLATCPDDAIRDGSEAIELLEQIKPHDWMELDTLAAAYAETGRFDEAIVTIKQALIQADADTQDRLKYRLGLYQTGKPYREELIKASQ